ncbi:hypothetical protein [Gordonia crocea]|uniref:Uncharacterized protein n=1 Tax=Gordonia crocea TaxID=589162 RepID=A0A7I9V1C8_9ACTN|nr:hypothetical protein [Gordonia crocea]GED98870.1 hypothetical protein nbrc107697_29090 [Gordonia crocea]
MGMSAREWKTVAEDTVTILGEPWRTVGKGRRLRIIRQPVGWWLQGIDYENTSVGKWEAYGYFFGQTVYDRPGGDHGDDARRVFLRDPAKPNRVVTRVTPENTAAWTRLVDEQVFLRYRGAAEINRWPELVADALWREPGWRNAPDVDYSSHEDQLSRAGMIQSLCGAKPRFELVETLDWLIALAGDGDPEMRLSPRPASEYLADIREAIAARDRAGFENVINTHRIESLTAVAVPESMIGPVVFPQSKYRWWEDDQINEEYKETPT